MKIELVAGQSVELYTATGVAAGLPLAITNGDNHRLELAPTNTFQSIEYVQVGQTVYSRDGLSELHIRSSSSGTVWVDHPALLPGADGLPQGLFTGLRAITTQPYVEANVKNGLQFYGRASWTLDGSDVILAGASVKMYFQIGAKDIIVKLREFDYIAEELKLELFASPTGVSGGTDITIANYNLINPQATTVLQAKRDVTTVSDGTFFDSAPEYFFGGGATGQRVQAKTPQSRERIIPKNSDFLVKITNTGTGVARVSYYLDWYEGETDLPLIKP